MVGPPIIPALRHVLDASSTSDLAFLVRDYRRPFTDNGFGNRFREWCDKAGLPYCIVHGLCKEAAGRFAGLVCTEFEIIAITGHETLQEVEHYTKKSDSRRVVIGSANPKLLSGANQ